MATHLIIPAVAAPLMEARSPACIPAHSAASLTEATRGHFPLAAGQASPEASMVEELTVEEVTDENDARITVKSIQGA
jgi:hypothetical protein